MAEQVEISDFVRMLRECAPDATLKVTTHSIVVKHRGMVEVLPRGKGTPSKPELATGQLYVSVARKVARSLGLKAECVNEHFPGLLETESEVSGAPGGWVDPIAATEAAAARLRDLGKPPKS